MCKSLVWRGFFLGTLLLLLTAGVASSQMSPFVVQNTIAWGGPIQPPDVGSADKGPQTPVSTPVQLDANAQSSSDAPADTPPGADQTASPAGNVDNSTASTTSDNNTVRQLGTPFPLQLQPEGLKIGPFYVPSISDSFYYAVNSSPGQPTQTFVGNSVSANLIYTKALSNGVFAVQAREQMSLANSVRAIFNQSISATYNDQLSERWSLNANANFTYFQSSILANPQYLLSYNNAGVTQQTVFVPQVGSVMYETNSITLNYALNGRTHLTLSPIIGATFSGREGAWSSAYQFGGAVGINRDFTPNLNMGVFYALSHSATSGSTSPGWNNQNIGLSFSYKLGQSWSVSGSLAASGQLVAQVWTLTPTGTLRLLKSFGRSAIIAGYTRSEASNVFVSSGYYQQADVGYNLNLSRKTGFNVGVGQWQTVNTGFNQHGWRASGSTYYQLSPRLSMNGGYSFSHAEGVQTTSFAPYLGNTNTLSVGLTWFLGAHSGL